MKLTLTPEQIEFIIEVKKAELTTAKNKKIAEIEKEYNSAIAKLSKKYTTVNVNFDDEVIADSVVDEYTKESRKLYSKLYAAKKAGKLDEVDKLQEERILLNTKFGKGNRKK